MDNAHRLVSSPSRLSSPARRPRLERGPPPLPVDERVLADREGERENDQELGEVIADVVDAFGETVRTRLEFVEETVIARARSAGLQGLGVVGTAFFALAAWVCGVVALGLWLTGPLSGAAALGIIAGIHVVIAAGIAGATGAAGRREREV